MKKTAAFALVMACSSCQAPPELQSLYGTYRASDGSELIFSDHGFELRSKDPSFSSLYLSTGSNYFSGWEANFAAMNAEKAGVYFAPAVYNPGSDMAPKAGAFLWNTTYLPEERNRQVLAQAGYVISPTLLTVGAVFQLNVHPVSSPTCNRIEGNGLAMSLVVDSKAAISPASLDTEMSFIDIRNSLDDTCEGGRGASVNQRGYLWRIRFDRI